MGQHVVGIKINRGPKTFQAGSQGIFRALLPQAPALQIELISLQIFGMPARESLLLNGQLRL
jgi:hypothetical protein